MSDDGAPGARFARRLALLVLALLVAALAAGWAIQAFGARAALRQQQEQAAREVAALLAAALGALHGDATAQERLARAQFARGGLRRLELDRADGSRRLDLARDDDVDGVPAWFADLVSPPGVWAVAPLGDVGDVGDGTGETRDAAGALRVQLQRGDAVRALWHAALMTVLLVALAVAVALWVLDRALRGWRRALDSAVTQARAIGQGRLVSAVEPAVPELRDVTRAMNTMVRQWRERLQAQADDVARLQRQAQTDAVTGLAMREPFVARLGGLLSDAHAPPGALLIVRVPRLGRLNEMHGREAVDRLLGAVADLLLTYVERVPGSCAGRLNGSDFALGLPAVGIVRESAESLRSALGAAPAARLAGAEFLFGGCDGLRGIAPGAALAAADAALADAEAGDGITVAAAPDAALGSGAGGARAWRERIAQALTQGQVRLVATAVVDARGTLVHLESALQVPLEPGGTYLEARRWLALAARGRLMPDVDLAAVDLALRAIAADGRARCVRVAPQSVADVAAASALQSRLEAAGADAGRLAIECSDSAGAVDRNALRQAAAGWRRAGVTVGVWHAGVSARTLPRLEEIGVDYVKVDASHLRGVADDDAVRGYVRSLVALLHGLGLRAYAAGVDDARELAALWALGFDAAAGDAVAGPRE